MPHSDLALKSAEIEELTDLYFFRPVGSLIARGARATEITPSGLTITGALIGIAAGAPSKPNVPPQIGWLVRAYFGVQRWFVGRHGKVEAALAARIDAGRVRDDDRARYREIFYPLVRGWNFLGDNTRFFAVGVLVCLHRIDLFYAFVLVPMNLAFTLLWLWQRSADRRFLAGLSSSKMAVG